jgi:Chemotaxis response regulator containing a CheY-like receiver domain and a methylesterase domain
MRKVSVVILDDSLFVREALCHELEKDCNIAVVGKAATAYDARDLIVELQPDILICDVHLDTMSGIDFVRRLLPQYYIPVIFISANPKNKAATTDIDAKDFILKPAANNRIEADLFYRRIICSIKSIVAGEPMRFAVESMNQALIAIGASTGGADAIETLIRGLPAVMPPIVVSQHMPPQFTKTFAERINFNSRLSVKEAEEGDMLIPGQVYISPGGFNMAIRKSSDRFYVTLKDPTNPKMACPNIDVLLQSAAATHKDSALGILLTGMGRDGAVGLKAMHDSGAVTFGQDESSSIVYGMPQAAFKLGAVDFQMSPAAMVPKCIQWAEERC